MFSVLSLLTWEPSAAQVIKSYSRRLPAMNDFTVKLNFAIKVDPLNYESQNHELRTFPWPSRVPQPKFVANRSRGS